MVKQICLIFIASLAINIVSYSQNRATNFPLQLVQKGRAYETKVLKNDITGKIILAIGNDQSVNYLLLSNDLKTGEILKPANANFPRNWALGGVINNNGFNFIYCMSNPRQYNTDGIEQHYRIETIDFNNKTISDKEIFVKPKEEQYVAAFSIQHRYYFISTNDKNEQLILTTIDENGALSRKFFYIDLKQMLKDKISLSAYFGYADIFSPEEESDMTPSVSYTKIFTYPDKLIITVTNYGEPPHLFNLDLQKLIITKKIISLDGFCGLDTKKKDFWNSNYIYKNKFYVLNACKEQIDIGIYDSQNFQLLKKYEIKDLNSVPISELPTQTIEEGRKGKDAGHSNEKELSMKDLLKALKRYQPDIAIMRNNAGQLILNCGSYDRDVITSSGGYYMPTMTMVEKPTGQTHEGSNIPVTQSTTQVNMNGRYVQSKVAAVGWKTHATTFKIVLDPNSLEAIKSDNTISRPEKIGIFIASTPPDSQGGMQFNVGDRSYYGFYSLATGAFTIQEIQL